MEGYCWGLEALFSILVFITYVYLTYKFLVYIPFIAEESRIIRYFNTESLGVAFLLSSIVAFLSILSHFSGNFHAELVEYFVVPLTEVFVLLVSCRIILGTLKIYEYTMYVGPRTHFSLAKALALSSPYMLPPAITMFMGLLKAVPAELTRFGLFKFAVVVLGFAIAFRATYKVSSLFWREFVIDISRDVTYIFVFFSVFAVKELCDALVLLFAVPQPLVEIFRGGILLLVVISSIALYKALLHLAESFPFTGRVVRVEFSSWPYMAKIIRKVLSPRLRKILVVIVSDKESCEALVQLVTSVYGGRTRNVKALVVSDEGAPRLPVYTEVIRPREDYLPTILRLSVDRYVKVMYIVYLRESFRRMYPMFFRSLIRYLRSIASVRDKVIYFVESYRDLCILEKM